MGAIVISDRVGERTALKVVMTGGQGFLAWHTACRLRALWDVEPERLSRAQVSDPSELAKAVARADVVMHLAGVNRADSEDDVRDGNIRLAVALSDAICRRNSPVRLVYANSIQSKLDTPYGRSKAEAADILKSAVDAGGGTLVSVLLPNLFGEHGRPHYNSFVATFAHEVSQDREPIVTGDREIPLLHVQGAAQKLIEAAFSNGAGQMEPPARPTLVSEVLGQLQHFHGLYSRGELPDLSDPFSVDLFNTYRSFTFPLQFPMHPRVHSDTRGDLVETVRSHGGGGQAFASTTVPGATRGDHYHLRKVERFMVVKGEAEIRLRRLLHDEVTTIRVSGDAPAFVDMPTLWTHSITNVGQSDLVTVFWADQLLDPADPDQYPEYVLPQESR